MAKGIFATDSGGGDFENPEAGSYIARCYKLIDIGTQQETYLGKPTDPKRKLYMWLELLEDEDGNEYRMSDGRPFSVMQRYTLSTNKQATLRKHLDAWRGQALTGEEAKAFNVVALLDKYCRVQITLDDKGERTYVNVASVGHTKKKPAGVAETFWWTVEDPDMAAFNDFPEWLQNKIKDSEEWSQAAKTMTADVVPTDIDDPLDVSELEF